ncbi:MAG TPA: AbrB/MazE/SpoVT family DNA-binding domain-containing protein [Intrasporangium sp.]|nr:AbrB/MazE/SpoVT family DNA-binding domain-containing protein [Intrasporangium sp.]
MRTTIDAAGRVVVPKALREAMRLRPGQPIDIVFVDGHLEIEVSPASVHVDDAQGFPIAVPDDDVPPLTIEVVRETLDETRR